MFSFSRVYRNIDSTYTAPVMAQYLESVLQMSTEDQELYNILKSYIPDTSINREILAWTEPLVISFLLLSSETIAGDRIKIGDPSNEVVECIEEFNDQINNMRQNIHHLFNVSYADNGIHAGSVWRVMKTKDSSVNCDIARLDPLTIQKIKEPVSGWEAFVQNVRTLASTYYSEEAFYNACRGFAWTGQYGISGGVMEHPGLIPSQPGNKVPYICVVPNKRGIVLDLEFFTRPLISPILPYLVYKKWIIWFMRKYSERFWSPFRVGYVGDPKTYMPTDPEDFKFQRDDLLNSLVYMKNFGSMATAGFNRVEEMGTKTASSSLVYPEYINTINEEIMFSLCGSMGQRTAKGNELASGRILEHGFLNHCKGMRGQYRRYLSDFYRNVLLPLNHLKTTTKKLEITFSPIQEEKVFDIVRALGEANKNCFFQDMNEPRQVLSSIWDGIGEVDKATASRMKADFMELNKKSVPQPGGAPPTKAKHEESD